MKNTISLLSLIALTGCAFHPSRVPSAPEVSELTVTTNSGDVRITSDNVDEPVITHRHGAFSAESHPTITLTEDGRRLVIDDGCARVTSPVCHVDFNIVVPRRRLEVTLVSDSGDLLVRGLEGRLTARTDSSDLRLEAAALETVALHSDSGDLELRGTAATQLTLVTDSGRLDADRLSHVGHAEVRPLEEARP